VKLLKLPPERLIGHNRRLDLNSPYKAFKLRLELLLSGSRVNSSQALLSFVSLSMRNKLSRRLRTARQQSGKDDGGNAADSDHVSPAMRNIGKSGSKTVGNQLTQCHTEVVEGNHATTVLGWGELSNVERLDTLVT
jgi:hypothetical protein